MSLTRRRNRGAALVLVLVVLLLMTVLAAEIALSAHTHHQLSRHSMNDFLLRTAALGRAQVLRAGLRHDGTNGSNIDTEDDSWAFIHRDDYQGWGEAGDGVSFNDSGAEGQGYRNRDVDIECWVEDERSKLNLLGLARDPKSRNGADGVHEFTKETLIRIIDLYREGRSDLDLSESDAREMVDALVDYLSDQEDSDENPEPHVKAMRGRLQSVDDLLRIPGGHWTRERLYDVRDPDWELDEDGQRVELNEEIDEEDDVYDEYQRSNGVPGLARFLTVFGEPNPSDDAPPPDPKINVNTASRVLIKALVEPQEEDIADALIEWRRAGSDEEDGGGSTGGEGEEGYFRTKQQLTQLEEIEKLDANNLPRLNFFADVQSTVFSVHVIAKMITIPADAGELDDDERDEYEGPKDVVASYQYREVVLRVNNGGGLKTLFVERRNEPIYER